MLKKFAALTLTFVSTSALASNWVEAAKGGPITWYVDTESVKSITDMMSPVKKVWARIEYRPYQNGNIEHSMVLMYYNCEAEQGRWVSWTDYKADGSTIVEGSSTQYAYRPVVPDSLSSAAMKIVCP